MYVHTSLLFNLKGALDKDLIEKEWISVRLSMEEIFSLL